MLSDRNALELYVGTVNQLFNGIFKITAWESELLQKSNILTKRKNLHAIRDKYRLFSQRAFSEWMKLYDKKEILELSKNTDAFYSGQTLYATTSNQKHVEQFLFWLYNSLEHYAILSTHGTASKLTKSAFFSGLEFSSVVIHMKALLPIVLEMWKNHKLNSDGNAKESFVEINQRILDGVPIGYRKGEEITDSRLEQMLANIENGGEKKRKDSDGGVKNGQAQTHYQMATPSLCDLDVSESANKTVKDKKEETSPNRQKTQETKVWLSADGTVKCPGDVCPKNCDTSCPIYLQTLAMPHLMNNRFEEAAKLLRNAVAIEPKFADAWNNLAACYGQMKDHQNAYAAYQRSYELLQKPNPLYGMAVATKNMKDFELAKFHADTYVKKFGMDERIKSLIAEISENELSAKVSEKEVKAQSMSDMPQPQKKQDEPSPAAPSAKEMPVKAAAVPLQKEQNTELPLENMRRFGKFVLLLFDEDTKEAGYAGLEKMVDLYPESCILLGQFYNINDVTKARIVLKKAADKGIAEAQWEYSQLLPHPSNLDFSVSSDREYLKYCLAAAEGGCPNAALEVGNICRRKKYHIEAAYWYGMANSLGHEKGWVSLNDVAKEYAAEEETMEFCAHLDNFNEDRKTTALYLLNHYANKVNDLGPEDLMRLALKGENLAGFVLGESMENSHYDDLAYKVYNALAFENHPHALRCCADMLFAGKGTTKDIDGAFRIYEMAAMRGNAVAMFIMGQKALKDRDRYLAACWFGQAYSREPEMTAEWIRKL